MASNLTFLQINALLTAFNVWLCENTENIAEELCGRQSPEEAIVVAETTAGDVQKGSAVLGVFTARSALRKVVTWFDQSRQWTDVERQEFLTVLLREAQDAITNCNTALYHLTGPSSAPSAIDPSLDTFLNGGDK